MPTLQMMAWMICQYLMKANYCTEIIFLIILLSFSTRTFREDLEGTKKISAEKFLLVWEFRQDPLGVLLAEPFHH